MKKFTYIFVLVILICFATLITSCGSNGTHFDWGKVSSAPDSSTAEQAPDGTDQSPESTDTAIIQNGLYFKVLSDGSYGVRASANLSTTVVDIPAKINGKSVTAILSNGFKGLDIVSVTIPDTVKEIRDSAFENCASLTSVSFGGELTGIKSSAFKNCTSLLSLTLPASLEEIDDYAFANCTGLYELTLEITDASVFGFMVFSGCESIRTLTVYAPKMIESLDLQRNLEYVTFSGGDTIPSYLFEDSATLKAVNIGEGIKTIKSGAFKNCSALTEVNVPSSLKTVEAWAFSECSALTAFNLNCVEEIGDYAFASCSSIKEITIPDSVKSLGSGAFQGCSSASKLSIGSGVTAIRDRAFSSCTKLTEVAIPDSVTTIGSHAFVCCTSLKSVVIGNGVTEIESIFPFSECTALRNVTVADAVIMADLTDTPESIENVTITGGKSIPNFTFWEFENLKSITLPSTLRTIGDSAFYDCKKLTSIVVPNGVTSIGQSAFGNCSALKNITLPSSIKQLGYNMVFGCYALRDIYFDGTADDWSSVWKFDEINNCTIHCNGGNIKN